MANYDDKTRLKLLKLEAERYVSLAKSIGYADISEEDKMKVTEMIYGAALTILEDFKNKGNLETKLEDAKNPITAEDKGEGC